MAYHPPSTLYDRIEAASLLSELEQAQLSALAEQIWRDLDVRVTRPQRAALERSFWSLIAEWESLPAVHEEPTLPGEFGLERIQELEMRLGEQFIGGIASSTPRVDLSNIMPDEEVLFDFPRQMARGFGVFPVRKQERLIELACANPHDWNLWLRIAEATGCRIRLLFASAKEIERAIKRYYPDARDPAPLPPLRMSPIVRNPESLGEDGFDLEFAEMEVMRQVCGDLIGKILSEGLDCLMIEPAESILQLSIFTDGWRPLNAWPRNLWRPLDLAFRKISRTPTQPWEQEGVMPWPFMGIEYRVWLMWRVVDGVPTLTLQPMLPDAENA